MGKVVINLNLDPAAILYRSKLFLRKSADIPARMVELPSFSWQIAKQHVQGLSEKDVIRSWMRYFAAVTAFIAKQRKQAEFSYVALIQFTSTADSYSLSVKCAYPQVIEPLKDAAKREDVAAQELDIQHKFALVDTLCPVVFMYIAANKRVLITNENHLGNPHQFLDVERCNFTSGMLNFIGAVNLLEAADAEGSPMQAASSWIQAAMAARRDEWLRWFFHAAEENVLFAPLKFRVDPANPESFVYDYSGK